MGVNGEQSAAENGAPKTDLQLYQAIFEKFEPDLTIDSYEESQGSKQGDNYTAALYRVVLRGHTVKEGEKKRAKWEKTVICKRLPDSQARREAYKSEHLFRNEVEFYTCILPEFQKFQLSKSRDIFNATPQCFHAVDDLIILEDMCLKKFRMQDRIEGLNLAQLRSLFAELAKFHAISLAYRDERPDEYEKLRNKISEGIFKTENTEWYRDYYKTLTQNAIQMVKDSLPENSKYVEKIKEFCTNFFPKIVSVLNKPTNLAVLCHGDCWTNNVLFKYAENGDIAEICLVDFQLMRYGSLTLDLANVLYCSVDADLRKQHLDTLLREYYEQLVQHLKKLGGIPKSCTGTEEGLWKLIQDEFRTFARFGLGLSMDMLPISTCSSEEAPDVYEEEQEAVNGAPGLGIPVNELCRRRMADLVVELVDSGLL